MRNPILADFLERRGATKRVAAACGVSHAAVSQWRAVPARHRKTVAKLIGVEPDRLGRDVSARPAQQAAE